MFADNILSERSCPLGQPLPSAGGTKAAAPSFGRMFTKYSQKLRLQAVSISTASSFPVWIYCFLKIIQLVKSRHLFSLSCERQAKKKKNDLVLKKRKLPFLS